MEFIKHYVVTGLLFAGVDAVWLMFVAKKFYWKEIGPLLLKKPNMGPAIVFYLIYITGIVVFALQPALHKASLGSAVAGGAFLGFVMYATYDLTNDATLKNWSRTVTYVDMAWGTFATGLTTTLAFLIFN